MGLGGSIMHWTGNRYSGLAVRTLVSVLALSAALAGDVSAQQDQTIQVPSSTETPPVAVGPGWRYEKRSAGGADLHQFFCQQPRCGPHSAVSFMIYPPRPPVTLEQFRRDQETTLAALRERAAPGTKITVLEIKGGDGSKLPSVFEVRRLTEFPNGTKSYRVSSTLFGEKYTATLISTSQDEEAAAANHALYAVAVMLFIGGSPK
jgi:hypothetical protein